MDEVTLT